MNAIRDSTISPSSKIENGCHVVGTTMGRHSFCGQRCVLHNVDIGSFCSIADEVYIGGASHPMHFVSTSPAFLSHRDSIKKKYSRHLYHDTPRTFIGNDVWIGHGAKIKAGIQIGDGAVIGMGSVVTRDVRDYAIVAGNPAREIRRRFRDEMVDVLLELEWWNFDDEHLARCASRFDNPEDFLKGEGLL